MGAAIGLAAVLIVMGIFMPDVVRALETLLLTFLDLGTKVLGTIKVDSSTEIYRALR